MKRIIIAMSALLLLANVPVSAEEDGHKHQEKSGQHGEVGQGGEHKEEGAPIKLSPTQVKQAGIKTIRVQYQAEKRVLSAQGSVSENGYHLAEVTALVDGVVDARHVRLGDKVKKGKRLVTLISSALAQSQADFLRAEASFRTNKLELERLEELIKEKIISQARFQQAQSSYQAARANLAAAKASLSSYGMRNRDIDALMTTKH